MWEFYCVRFLFYSTALSYGEDGHAERSLSFTSRPDLDSILVLLNMCLLLMTPVKCALLRISLQLPQHFFLLSRNTFQVT